MSDRLTEAELAELVGLTQKCPDPQKGLWFMFDGGLNNCEPEFIVAAMDYFPRAIAEIRALRERVAKQEKHIDDRREEVNGWRLSYAAKELANKELRERISELEDALREMERFHMLDWHEVGGVARCEVEKESKIDCHAASRARALLAKENADAE